MLTEDNTISILTIDTIEDSESMFPSYKKVVGSYSQIAVEKLKDSLSDFIKTLGTIVEALPDRCGNYELDTLTFSLSINGMGKISLVGELSAGLNSGLTITLKKVKKERSNEI